MWGANTLYLNDAITFNDDINRAACRGAAAIYQRGTANDQALKWPLTFICSSVRRSSYCFLGFLRGGIADVAKRMQRSKCDEHHRNFDGVLDILTHGFPLFIFLQPRQKKRRPVIRSALVVRLKERERSLIYSVLQPYADTTEVSTPKNVIQ